MKLGAYDYLLKPFDVPKLKEVVLNALKAAREMREGTRYNFEPGGRPLLQPEDLESEIVGQSAPMREVFKLIGQFASTDTTVLITGESGTGKELVAKAIWQHSDRSKGPFVAMNCAAIPEQLLESELFGHERGAFTGATNRSQGRFEQANGGTLFLDEIGDMPLGLQTRLLRVLEEHEVVPLGADKPMKVDLRVVCASHQNLRSMIARGQFREDLYYRLNGITLELPCLVDRTDKEQLIRKLLGAETSDGRPVAIEMDAFQRLLDYDWPGNIRELRNVIRTALAICDGGVVRLRDLPSEVRSGAAQAAAGAPPAAAAESLDADAAYDMRLSPIEAAERQALVKAIRETEGNMARAATVLQVSRSTLYRRCRRLHITHRIL
jgi:DNA-binding NtrC family response regulator